MANLPCPISSPCLEPSYANLTAEGPDPDFFIGTNWGNPQNDPPLNSEWQDWSCMGVCESTVSQAAADAAAAIAQAECVESGGAPLGASPTSGNPPKNLAGGGGGARNVSPVSIQPFDGSGCLNQPISPVTLGATGHKLPFTFNLAVGSLPPGMEMVSKTDGSGFIIGGTPTACGTYNFTVSCTDASGITGYQDMSFSVFGISTTALPEGTCQSPYSAILTACGGVPPYTWSVDPNNPWPSSLSWATLGPGSPNGMTGEISGTPGPPGTFNNLGILITDSNGSQCTAKLSLTINGIGSEPTGLTISCGELSTSASLPFGYFNAPTDGGQTQAQLDSEAQCYVLNQCSLALEEQGCPCVYKVNYANGHIWYEPGTGKNAYIFADGTNPNNNAYGVGPSPGGTITPNGSPGVHSYYAYPTSGGITEGTPGQFLFTLVA